MLWLLYSNSIVEYKCYVIICYTNVMVCWYVMLYIYVIYIMLIPSLIPSISVMVIVFFWTEHDTKQKTLQQPERKRVIVF